LARLIEAEVWEHRPGILTGAAELVLIRLADSAGTDHRMVWIGENTLIEDTRKDRSTVYDALYLLRELNIIRTVPEDEWPPQARRYASVVRQINPVSQWAVIRSGGVDVVQDTQYTLTQWKIRSRRRKPKISPEPPSTEALDDAVEQWHESSGRPDGVDVSLREHLGMTDVQYADWAVSGNPTGLGIGDESGIQPQRVGFPDPNQKQNQEQKEETPSLLTSRHGATKRQDRDTDPEAGLDPADGLFDMPESPTDWRTTHQAFRPDTGLGLVAFFEQALRATAGGRRALLVPDPIHRRALAATLNRWKRTGVPPDRIRAWMISYADSCGSRKSVVPPWKDFLSRRAGIAASVTEQTEHETRHDPDHPDFAAYWGLTPEEAASLITPLDSP
jgi:hypothetical protein